MLKVLKVVPLPTYSLVAPLSLLFSLLHCPHLPSPIRTSRTAASPPVAPPLVRPSRATAGPRRSCVGMPRWAARGGLARAAGGGQRGRPRVGGGWRGRRVRARARPIRWCGDRRAAQVVAVGARAGAAASAAVGDAGGGAGPEAAGAGEGPTGRPAAPTPTLAPGTAWTEQGWGRRRQAQERRKKEGGGRRRRKKGYLAAIERSNEG